MLKPLSFAFQRIKVRAPLPRYCALYDPSRQQYKVISLVAALISMDSQDNQV